MAKLRYTFDGKTQYKHKIYQKKKKPLLNDICFDVLSFIPFFFIKKYIYIVLSIQIDFTTHLRYWGFFWFVFFYKDKNFKLTRSFQALKSSYLWLKFSFAF